MWNLFKIIFFSGFLTFENQSIKAWQHIFEICAAQLLICGSIYIWLNDTTIQPWNNAAKAANEMKELEPLQKNNESKIAEIEKLENEKELNKIVQ